MTPRRPIRNQAHQVIGYLNPTGSGDGNWAERVERRTARRIDPTWPDHKLEPRREPLGTYSLYPRRARDERSEFLSALFVLLLCFAALVAWLFVAWAAQ